MICHYYLTFRCQCRCEFCGIWHEARFDNTNESGFGVVQKNLSGLKKIGVTTVHFTGGEPLLRDDLGEILHSAKRNGLKTLVTTAGLEFSKRSSDLKGLIDELYVSLDAPESAEHDRIRGQECFQEAIGSIASARNCGARPIIRFTVTRDSVRYLPEMVEIAEKLGIHLYLSPVHHYFGLEGLEKNTVDYVLRYSGRKSVILSRALFRLIGRGGNDRERPVCRALEVSITISPDGHLILPCINAFNASVPVEGNLEKVWRSDIVEGYRKLQGRLDQCAGCADADYISPSIWSKLDRHGVSDHIARLLRKPKASFA